MPYIIDDLKQKFIEVFGGSAEGIRVFAAPGRVNLIGEHTDYNGGYVFPAALTLGAVIVARPREDKKISMYANDLGLRVDATLEDIEASRSLKWGNYQMGVLKELIAAGCPVIGCDMLYEMDLPPKSGLSSSAAIEVATAVAAYKMGISAAGKKAATDMVQVAILSQRAEHNFIGVKCGIMDQFASAMGKKDNAILLDCKNLNYKYIPLELQNYKLVISNTNCKRSLSHSKYNERRTECESGLEILKKALPHATCLGDITLEQFEEYKSIIGDEVIRKRVEFVISENDRVLKSVNALQKGKLAAFGKLMSEAHESIRNLYEVTGLELDTLVEEALKIDGVMGARMTGAGFGGCTVSIVEGSKVSEFVEKVGRNYKEKTGIQADFYICEVGDGGREIL